MSSPRAGAQDGLFAGPETGALVGPESAKSVGNGAGAGKPGRPAGSQNRATRERRDFYLTRYSDPLEGAIAFSLPADLLEGVARARALAKALGCKPLEALEFMRRAAADAMPFLHAKAVELKVNTQNVHAHFAVGDMLAIGQANPQGLAQLRQLFDEGLSEEAESVRATIEAQAVEDLTQEENQGNSDA